MPQQPQKTMFAQKAVDLTSALSDRFADLVLDGEVPRRPRFLAPEVETTSGGRQARQSIQLVPLGQGPDGPLVCGFIDVGAGMAHLRSLASIESLQQSRNGRPLRLSGDGYKDFLEQLGRELAGHRILTRMTTEIFQARDVVDAAASAKTAAPGSVGMAFVMGAFVLGLALGVSVGAAVWSPQSPLRARPVVENPAP